jgi:hypothetical protein
MLRVKRSRDLTHTGSQIIVFALQVITQSSFAVLEPRCALANVSGAACLLTDTGNVDYGLGDGTGCDGD